MSDQSHMRAPLLRSPDFGGPSNDNGRMSHSSSLHSHRWSQSTSIAGSMRGLDSRPESLMEPPTSHFRNGNGNGNGNGSGSGSRPESRQSSAAPSTQNRYIDNQEDHEFDPLHDFRGHPLKDVDGRGPFRWDSIRGYSNAAGLLVILAGIVGLFMAWPVITAIQDSVGARTAGFNLGGINGTGQYPDTALPRLIDLDTPEEAYTKVGYDGFEWDLVYSDEFNEEGRTFFHGDDPYWEAMDMHYWGTNDYEWLDPSAVTTQDGALVMTMTQEPINGLMLKSGQIQSWNKLCFNRNAIWEVSAMLPGNSRVGGFWPAFWVMGNLGRPGYGGTTDGTWPYSYDSCDVGIMPNQTYANGTGPAAALEGTFEDVLSFLPGQRYPACTCPGEDHPGPSNDIGRSAPEVDLIEATVIIAEQTGEVSQTFQVAPYDDLYYWGNTSDVADIVNFTQSEINEYRGGPYQQAVSVLSRLPDNIYDAQDKPGATGGDFGIFELEWFSDFENRENGYITWGIEGERTWTVRANALEANPRTEVGRRIMPEEPMAMIVNFHASDNFQFVDWANLEWPAYFRVDYIRVYQREGGTMGCDPEDRPTADFINRHLDVYMNPNVTTWEQTGNTWPKNRLRDGC